MTEKDEGEATLAQRERAAALARKHYAEQGTTAAYRRVLNADASVRAWKATRPETSSTPSAGQS